MRRVGWGFIWLSGAEEGFNMEMDQRAGGAAFRRGGRMYDAVCPVCGGKMEEVPEGQGAASRSTGARCRGRQAVSWILFTGIEAANNGGRVCLHVLAQDVKRGAAPAGAGPRLAGACRNP